MTDTTGIGAAVMTEPAPDVRAAAAKALPGLTEYTTEQALLGAIIANNAVHAKVSHYLKPEHFADPLMGRIYGHIGNLIAEGKRADVLPLNTLMADDEGLAAAGGAKQLIALSRSVVVVFGAESYGPAIYEAWQRRWLVERAAQLVEEARDQSRPADEIAAGLAADLAQVAGLDQGAQSKRQVAEGLVAALQNPAVPDSTGIPKLDVAMGGGLFPGKLYGIAARKKVGKTLLLGSISHNLNAAGVSHLFVACEMSPAEIEARCAARVGGFNSVKFLTGEAPAAAVAEYAVTVPNNTIYEALPGGRFDDLKRVVARAIVRNRIKGVILDYWQLVGGKEPRDTEEYHLRMVAQWLADIGRQHGLWALVACQVNQQGNTRGGEGLKLSADMYFTMHRKKREPGAWLEMEETRYTLYADVGNDADPGLWLSKVGPHFLDASQRGPAAGQDETARRLGEDL